LVAAGVAALAAATWPQSVTKERRQSAVPASSAVDLLPDFKRRLDHSDDHDRVLWQVAAGYVRLNEFHKAQDVLDAIRDEELREMAYAALAVEGCSVDAMKSLHLVRARPNRILRAEALTVLAHLMQNEEPGCSQALLQEAQGLLQGAANTAAAAAMRTKKTLPRALDAADRSRHGRGTPQPSIE
jgi:hypothetical protein